MEKGSEGRGDEGGDAPPLSRSENQEVPGNGSHGEDVDRGAHADNARPRIRMIPFDFHSVCGKLAFRNLPLLVNECRVMRHFSCYAASLSGC